MAHTSAPWRKGERGELGKATPPPPPPTRTVRSRRSVATMSPPAVCDSRGTRTWIPAGQVPAASARAVTVSMGLESGCWVPSFNLPLNGSSVAVAAAPGSWACAGPYEGQGWGWGEVGLAWAPGGRCSIKTPKPRATHCGRDIGLVCFPRAPPAWTLKGAALFTRIRLSAHAAMRRGEGKKGLKGKKKTDKKSEAAVRDGGGGSPVDTSPGPTTHGPARSPRRGWRCRAG